jgi:hypothetical protein
MPNPNQQNQANVLNGLDRQLTAHVPAAPVSSQADDPVNLPPRLSLLDVLRENLQRVGKVGSRSKTDFNASFLPILHGSRADVQVLAYLCHLSTPA